MATLVSATPTAATSLRDVLTDDEFERAGLEKLTAAELEFLSRRLLDAPPTTGPVDAPLAHAKATDAPAPAAPTLPPQAGIAVTGEAAFGQEGKLRERIEEAHGIPDELTTWIAGTFHGWTGNTVFRLENGQVWEQIDDKRFAVTIENPAVKIERTRFGSYFFSIEGYGSRTKVRRVR